MAYDIWQDGRRLECGVTIGEAARICELNDADIEWAIGEHGRCDDDQGRTVVVAGSADPGPITEDMLECWAAG